MVRIIEDKLHGQYVVFVVESQLCMLSINEVVEIVQVQPITEVVNNRDFIVGVINLRGTIIPVVHLRIRYQLPIVPSTKKTRIIIIKSEDEEIGLLVDEVLMVTQIDEEQLEPPLEMFNSIEKDCFNGFAKVKEQLIGILNLQKVLYPEEVKEGN